MKNGKQAGSHVVALSLLVLVLGVVVFAGYTVMHHAKKTDNQTTASTQTTAPKTIQTKADLQTTAKSLDSSSSDLNTGLNDSSLDSSMNDLL
jgi:uncharacterized protein (UPF0333 family)